MSNPCKHCGSTSRSIWNRGLCRKCYFIPGMKDRYPKIRDTNTGLGISDGRHQFPLAEPTTAEPGTEEKVAVMCDGPNEISASRIPTIGDRGRVGTFAGCGLVIVSSPPLTEESHE